LWHITLPMISPATFYLTIINLIGAFHVFTPAYLLTRGGPNNATLTLPLYIYLNAFSWGRLGYASTVAFLSLAVILALTLLQFAAARRWVFYSGVEAP
jgi:multiple sugar transport system permease protein